MSNPIGPRRNRVTLELNTPVLNTVNNAIPNWSTVGTYWASIKPISGREAINAERLKVTATHLVTIRHVGTINAAIHRLVFNGRIFNIEFVNNIDERNRIDELMVKEVGNPA